MRYRSRSSELSATRNSGCAALRKHEPTSPFHWKSRRFPLLPSSAALRREVSPSNKKCCAGCPKIVTETLEPVQRQRASGSHGGAATIFQVPPTLDAQRRGGESRPCGRKTSFAGVDPFRPPRRCQATPAAADAKLKPEASTHRIEWSPEVHSGSGS